MSTVRAHIPQFFGLFQILIACLSATFTFGQDKRPDWPMPQNLDESWLSLPSVDEGNGTPLPTWARMLARSLPHTTAALLELEYLYRMEPLLLNVSIDSTNSRMSDQSQLAGVARYAVATYHQSAYGRGVAIADLKRAKAQAMINLMETNPKDLPPLEYEVFVFARQMAELGQSLTDEQYRSLQLKLGDEAMVGLVLRIAHGCFQDRLLWALGIADVADGNSNPIHIHFVDSTANGANTPEAAREDGAELLASIARDKQIDAPTQDVESANNAKANTDDRVSFKSLQQLLETQRERDPRISVPEWDTIAPKLPPGLYRRPLRIRWSRVVVGYQPKLGPAWIKCLRVFEQESHQDRVFEESVFWVVTRGLKCFYCMGHCEMLMEVGGLKPSGIADRTARLASGDWSSFSKGEQAAFRFAKKLTEAPTSIDSKDLQSLRETLGETRAIDLIWWTSRCQFMTKVSDAFQLRLERENVFAE